MCEREVFYFDAPPFAFSLGLDTLKRRRQKRERCLGNERYALTRALSCCTLDDDDDDDGSLFSSSSSSSLF